MRYLRASETVCLFRNDPGESAAGGKLPAVQTAVCVNVQRLVCTENRCIAAVDHLLWSELDVHVGFQICCTGKLRFCHSSHKSAPDPVELNGITFVLRQIAGCRSGRYNPVRRTGVLPFLHRQMCLHRRSVRRLWSPLPWSHCFPVPAASLRQPLSLYRSVSAVSSGAAVVSAWVLFCGRLCAALRRRLRRGCCASRRSRKHPVSTAAVSNAASQNFLFALFSSLLSILKKNCLASQPFFHDIP